MTTDVWNLELAYQGLQSAFRLPALDVGQITKLIEGKVSPREYSERLAHLLVFRAVAGIGPLVV